MAVVSLSEETTKKVVRQIEYYFSDVSLAKDKFLTKTIGDSEDGLVSLALLCSFTRMRGHLSLGEVKPEEISDNTVKAVAEILRDSPSLQVSEDGKRVGKAKEQVTSKTIAASPLERDVKIDDVKSFFSQSATVDSVRLPRHVADNKLFCGTALIEFSTEEEAEKILKQSLVFAGSELNLKPKKDFDEERAKQAKEVEKTRSNGANQESRQNAGEYTKGLILAFKLKNTSAKSSEVQNGGPEPADGNMDIEKSDGELNSVVNSNEKADEAQNDVKGNEEKPGEKIEESKEKVDDKGTLESEETEVKDSGKNGATTQKGEAGGRGKPGAADLYKDNKEVVLREDLRAVFEKYGSVKFIDFQIGDESGYIRFEEPDAAKNAFAAAVLTEEGGLVVKNYIASLDLVADEAEKEYWTLLRGNQGRHKGGRGRGGRHGGGRGRGGRHGKNFRSRGDSDSGSRPSKVQKV